MQQQRSAAELESQQAWSQGSVASSMLSPQIPLVGYQFLGAAAIAGLAGGVYDVGLLAMAGGGVAGGMIGARLAPQ